jgi:hypothetical protein
MGFVFKEQNRSVFSLRTGHRRLKFRNLLYHRKCMFPFNLSTATDLEQMHPFFADRCGKYRRPHYQYGIAFLVMLPEEVVRIMRNRFLRGPRCGVQPLVWAWIQSAMILKLSE